MRFLKLGTSWSTVSMNPWALGTTTVVPDACASKTDTVRPVDSIQKPNHVPCTHDIIHIHEREEKNVMQGDLAPSKNDRTFNTVMRLCFQRDRVILAK